MSSILAKDLSPEQRSSFQKAKEASDRNNHDYAIAILTQLVKDLPGNLEVRRLLRANAVLKFKNSSGMARSMSAVKIAPLGIRGGNALKKNPVEALTVAEEMLAIDPNSSQGNQLLADAAYALNAPEIAIIAYETLRDAKPDDLATLKNLGKAYLAARQTDKAIATFQKANQLAPNDGEALKGLKDASALSASSKGGWEQEGDFRQSLKSVDEAKLLEQQNRVVKSDEAIDNQLADLSAKYNENQTNLNIVKQIADLYERKNDLETALQWFEYASSLSGGADPELERRCHAIRTKKLELGIAAAKEQLKVASTAEEKGALEAQLEQLRAEKATFQLASAKERVDRYPNDLNLRFEYGQALFTAGQFKEAVPELQQSLKQPNVRLRALNFLGLCFWKRNMLDFAIKQFQAASSEMIGFDDLKKEVVYNLGCVLEQLGKKAEALDEFKKIYEVDYQYKDVAERVERSYENPPEA
jgi:tetratricopeptide (TPR) repeat protein